MFTRNLELLAAPWALFHAGDSANRSDGGARGPKDRLSAIVGAVLHTEECSRRALALAGKISDELEGAKMLAACEQVSKRARETRSRALCTLYHAQEDVPNANACNTRLRHSTHIQGAQRSGSDSVRCQ